MMLISIIIALVIERLGARSEHWQIDFYLGKYLALSKKQLSEKGMFGSDFGVMIWFVLPTILVALVYHLSDFVLFQLILNVLILLVCFGCGRYRRLYKGYLNALTRGDSEAVTLYALQMGQERTETERNGETFGQTLVWINFQHYCAVMFWFVMLGAPGAVLYASVRYLVETLTERQEDDLPAQVSLLRSLLGTHTKRFTKLLFWLNWLPARVASFGYLIIGNFTKGTGCWLKYLLDFDTPNRQVVSEIALAAEQIEQQFFGCTYEATCMMRLVKRNILFFLVLTALLTLFGGLS
ncbi:beta-lactamase regulator AmpE [Pseudoalteromonas sp. DL2-H2.2]|uniref:Regulatory protein n=1 Tax=Pseudoalteromonas rubra TaxID=43658 RepID=A0A0F4QK13_9GAMM|nr:MULTISPECIES: beta-lactamase regulator AmpE [Pseudoalteromonas]KJZ06997.1 regulatory protein [Pseudoalteromonas rubra]MCF2908870.1 beta-lactamase regulator AmpE [Pseudoalteromonas sp. DL2-H2.2]